MNRPILTLNRSKNTNVESAISTSSIPTTSSTAVSTSGVLKQKENKQAHIKQSPEEQADAKIKKIPSYYIALKDFKEILSYLQQHYPLAFPKEKFQPLAIGIHRQLIAASLPYSNTIMRKFLGKYVKSKQYVSELVVGNSRHSLDGSVSSIVLEDEINNKR